MQKKDFIYEGKAKQVYSTDDENLVIIHYKDDATAGNGVKKGTIKDKGIINNKITAKLFSVLEKNGIRTHFKEMLNERDQLCEKLEIVPLEVIVRNVITGSMAKRVGIADGTIPKTTIFEICYKNDEYGDPLINDYHAVAMGLATFDELKYIYETTSKINDLLKKVFDEEGITLVDFKVKYSLQMKLHLIHADYGTKRQVRNLIKTDSDRI